ncbi:ABC-type transport auxiliary lipoprotein family protein [Aestuariibacter sp. AA17]|uniref:ABC-type transport auxiliary lipoprotein family protein n=1 Tax=Fluctibacter corallii TaxID=2984329 RepID=A0ABT3ACI3_9ALTE|nr:ABC-type transport auxiliary lipoprotein family protein [Aestuariibacter sp. AA17]MCV2885997.1 ABC-type transport auxiliary lipoprotein family protein [Aestuariibacter sp. AA17]
MLKIMIVLACLFMTISCGTNNVAKLKYYLLSSPDTSTFKTHKVLTNTNGLRIGNVTTAEYLQRSQLPMLIGTHQVYYASQHLWAQPLTDDIRMALEHALAGLFSESNSADNATLHFHFDHFTATDNAAVICEGHYRVEVENTGPDSAQPRYPFTFTLPLDEDGFEHAISKLNQCISEISQQAHQDFQGTMNHHAKQN